MLRQTILLEILVGDHSQSLNTQNILQQKKREAKVYTFEATK